MHAQNTITPTKLAGAVPETLQHKQLVKQSQRLISQTFFGEMLKQMRNSPFKSKLFDGGRGGEAFSSMLDQRLADHMAIGAGKKLVNSMVAHIEKKQREKTGLKQEPAPEKKLPATRAQFERSPYFKRPARDGRSKNVPADFRA